MRGRFITFEGIDGAGKSTHLPAIAAWLESQGIPVLVTREPGGTFVGEEIRRILLDRGMNMHPDTETLLMFASRREHIVQRILPALASGQWVLCDRFTDASRAYQGGGRGVGLERIEILADWVQEGLEPDLTLYFDVPMEIARERTSTRSELDRFERESEAFHARVLAVYRELAVRESHRIRTIDGLQPIDGIQKILENIITMHCL